MLGDIARYLIDIIFTLFGAVLILRAWMQAVRLPAGNPLSSTVIQVSNWLVLPLRRAIKPVGGIDWASIAGAWLTALVFLLLTLFVTGANPLSFLPVGLLVAVLTVLKWAVNLLMWMTLVMAVLSWVNPHSPAYAVLAHLTAPFLNPIRRVMPLVGGVDLSPLILFVLTQIALMVLARVSVGMFGLY
jgi:YggT family protein